MLLKIIETMKQDEEVEVSVKPEYIKTVVEDADHPYYKNMNSTELVIFYIKCEKLIQIHDIKEDGSLLKKTMQYSFSSAQAEPGSRIYFDYKIF